ncbi:hypothetical protein Ahy_B10g104925 [Arachis hypogaea]|uniref:Protein FAR1-RELATED SEQUENCE n=1 Tax=Arachis hypogaea TaxID=3818 RepID=A0A444X734_ARAHY|nr:hypothetical protein Ahy_B10g104925 [Arachis hypogaea]
MDDSTSNCQLNQSEVDFEFESNEVPEFLCDVDEQFVPKVGMTFNTLEDIAKFYKDYSKAAEILKQHRELSMSVHRTIENNEEAKIKPSKTYQSYMNSHTKESFDRNWNDLLMKYGLVDNKWLSEQVFNSIFNKFAVTYDSVAAQVKCQCLLFESRRILFRHTLSVLSFERVNKVSPRYILERWSKNVKRRHTYIKSSHDEPLLEPRSKRFDELVFCSQNVYEFASESEQITAILHRTYDNIVVEMQELKSKWKGTCSLSQENANLESVNELQSLPRVRTRGRPKNILGSKLDKQIANASKKKKMKSLSELNLFYGASVVQPNSIQYHGHIMNSQFRDPTAGDRFWVYSDSILVYR